MKDRITLDEARKMAADGDYDIPARRAGFLATKGYDTRLTDDQILEIEIEQDDDLGVTDFTNLMVQAEQPKPVTSPAAA